MKAADTADNSHSGDHCDPHEMHLRDKLLQHINAAMPERQYRFFGHRLAELRGLFTNVMHNELVAYFREKYGEDACIDLQYYTEGVNYLLDKQIELEWTADTLCEKWRPGLKESWPLPSSKNSINLSKPGPLVLW